MPDELGNAQKRLQRLQQAKAELEQEAEAQWKALSTDRPKRKPGSGRPRPPWNHNPLNPKPPHRESPPTPAGDALSPDPVQTSPANPFAYPERTSWVPGTVGATYDANLNSTGAFRLPMPPGKATLVRNR